MDELKFEKPEPKKFITRFLELDMEMETDEHSSWRIEKEHYDRFNSITKEQRQEIVDLFRKGGITIGEIGEKLKINSRIVGDVIYLNIEQSSYLRDETL